MNDNLQESEYATKDLYLAAFIYVKGQRIKKLEKYGSDTREQIPVYFIFEGRKKCERLEGIFWSGVGEDASVNVKQYTTTIRDLRARASSVSRTFSQAKEDEV